MKKTLVYAILVLTICTVACKKSSTTTTPDVKDKFVGAWAGAQQVTGVGTPYKFSITINADNTLVNIDSAFGNQSFPGTYTYTTDSLKITYNNGTKWNLKFLNNYTSCTGTLIGFSGATGTISMNKK